MAVSLTGPLGQRTPMTTVPWTGPWEPDDPDANFKEEVSLYAYVDPMETIGNLSSSLNIPESALIHYILAKWASVGSGGLLELGPSMVERLWGLVATAEAAGTDRDRLDAYHALHSLLAWLRLPLIDTAGYPPQ